MTITERPPATESAADTTTVPKPRRQGGAVGGFEQRAFAGAAHRFHV